MSNAMNTAALEKVAQALAEGRNADAAAIARNALRFAQRRDQEQARQRAEVARLSALNAKMLELLKAIELLARVNSFVTDGSPMHKAILKLLKEAS